jgi:hypothetical protein
MNSNFEKTIESLLKKRRQLHEVKEDPIVDMIRTLLSVGASIELIASITKCSVEEIKKIKDD